VGGRDTSGFGRRVIAAWQGNERRCCTRHAPLIRCPSSRFHFKTLWLPPTPVPLPLGPRADGCAGRLVGGGPRVPGCSCGQGATGPPTSPWIDPHRARRCPTRLLRVSLARIIGWPLPTRRKRETPLSESMASDVEIAALAHRRLIESWDGELGRIRPSRHHRKYHRR
jgi:hypothetical protein